MEVSELTGCPPSFDEMCVCGKTTCGKLKYIQPSLRNSFKPSNECRKSNIPIESNTTSKLSYQPPLGFKASEPFKPKRRSLDPFNISMDANTTYKLSFMPRSLPVKEQYPWAKRQVKTQSNVPMANNTTHRLSFRPVTLPVKEQYPWTLRKISKSNVPPMANHTIQHLSYMPPGEFVKIGGCNCVHPGQCLDDCIT